MQPADRLSRLPMYVFASLGARIRALQAEGLDVIRLDIGSPDMPPPDLIIEALHRSALNPDHHGYAGYLGTPALRQATADYYAQRFGVALDPASEGDAQPHAGRLAALAGLRVVELVQVDHIARMLLNRLQGGRIAARTLAFHEDRVDRLAICVLAHESNADYRMRPHSLHVSSIQKVEELLLLRTCYSAVALDVQPIGRVAMELLNRKHLVIVLR